MNKKYLSMKNGLSNWLSESGIVTADGSVYSWLNPENPGYVYNEIMGYYTKFATFIFHSHSDKTTVPHPKIYPRESCRVLVS